MSKKEAFVRAVAGATAKGAVNTGKAVADPVLRAFERAPIATTMAGGLGYYGAKGAVGSARAGAGNIPGRLPRTFTPHIRPHLNTNPAHVYQQTGMMARPRPGIRKRAMKMSDIRERVKTAAPVSFGKRLGQAALIGGASTLGLAGATGLLHAGSSLANRIGGARQRTKSYENMLQENPSMEDNHSTRRAFATIHRFAPDVADDPIVSSTFVKRVVNYGDVVDPKQVKELVETQDKMKRTTSFEHPLVRSFSGGFESGLSKSAQLEASRMARMREEEQERFEGRWG